MRPLHAIKKMSFVYIPMRDGVELCADISLPKKPGKYPAILMRTPYGRRLDEYFAARGYIYCSVDARATGASGGEYKYYNIEDGLHDGYDLVEWLAAQEYCDGNIGTLGGSAPVARGRRI
jgi:putative CocE/NonD family hydrolase